MKERINVKLFSLPNVLHLPLTYMWIIYLNPIHGTHIYVRERCKTPDV